MVNKQSVLIINVLDAGEISRNKDLSDFDKGQIVMARRRQGLWVPPGQQFYWAPKAHRCMRAAKAILSRLSQQKVYCGASHTKY